MVRARNCLVSCACLLDLTAGEASWASVPKWNSLDYARLSSGMVSRPARLKSSTAWRKRSQQQRQRSGSPGTTTSSGHLHARPPSFRRCRGGALRCEGDMNRGWGRAALLFFIFRLSSINLTGRGPAPADSNYNSRCSGRQERLPLSLQYQRHQSQRPREGMFHYTRVQAAPQQEDHLSRRCLASVTTRTGASRPDDEKPAVLRAEQDLEQQQQQQQQPSEDPTAVYVRPEVPGWRYKAVIIPGFATDARAFEQFCHRLERRGIASVVVPIRWYHWLPTLGGRSVRPILDRIHETVIRCVRAKEHKDMPYAFNEPGRQKEVAPYTAQDFLAEMGDPSRGAHHMGPLDLPLLPANPSEDERVMLVAHSAGGWISRIYLSEARYDGRTYNASSLVNGLVTLGTPHVRLEDDLGRPRELPFSRNFKFVEDFCAGKQGGDWEKRTPTACIGGAAVRGRSTFGGLFKDLVYRSYELCCGDGSGMGDGITPLTSAFDMAGAQRYVELEGVLHAAGLGGPWYGSDNVIDSHLVEGNDRVSRNRFVRAEMLATETDRPTARMGNDSTV